MIRAAALLLTVLTGFTALVYQVAWQKYLAALLGSHSEATAIVLGIFLGGLSWGYALFGKISTRALQHEESQPGVRLLRYYGWAEGSIGLYALVFPWLFLAVRWLSLALPQGSDVVSFAIDIVLTALLIGPPAVLMGGTIPLLTQALASGLDDATRFHAWVYGFNTLGAFGGALCGGFFLVPRLGLQGVVLAMGLVNVAVGALFLLLSKSLTTPVERPTKAARTETSMPDGTAPNGVSLYLAAAALSGFAMMTVQTVANRVAAFSLGSSPFTFSMVVASFVLCIALGSFAVTLLPRIPRWVLPLSQFALAGLLLAAYSFVPDGPYWAHVLRGLFRDDPHVFLPFQFAVFCALFALLLLPVALSGATLPLIFHQLRREVTRLGGVAGRLYSWNTVGSLAGALLGGYALLFWLDLHQVFRIAVATLLAAAALLTGCVFRRLRPLGWGVFVVGVVLLTLLPAWSPNRLSAGTFRNREPFAASWAGPDAFYEKFLFPARDGQDPVAFYEDDPTASIAVLRIPFGSGTSLGVVTNGKNDSALPGDHVTTGLLGLLPALFAEKAERSFVVGYGTGLTTGELARLETMQQVVVAEIARGVLRAAPLFEPLNGNAATNPKTRIVRSDAYRALLRSEGNFDVIASEPSNPWVSGIELLYSLDFLQAARDRLAPGGVFCQWIHIYETDDATVNLALNTFREAFDEAAVWYGSGKDLLVLGFKDGTESIDLAQIERRWARADFNAAFGRLGLTSFPALLGHELLPLGVLHAIELPDELHTVLRPRLSERAARAFFAGGSATLPRGYGSEAARLGARNSFLRRYAAGFPAGLDEAARTQLLDEVCAHQQAQCVAHLAQWKFEAPSSAALERRLAALGNSAGLDWRGTTLRLASLFSPGGTAGLPGEYEYATRVDEVFREYYQHAAPFDARALRGPWQRCTGDSRCSAGLERALTMGVELPVEVRP